MSEVLTEAQRQEYEIRGALVFDPGIPDAVLDRARTEAEEIIASRPYRPEMPNRVQDGWRPSRGIHQVAIAPKVRRMLTELYGRRARPFQTLNFMVGTEQLAHADTVHFNSEPAGFMCGVWVALEDVDADNGPVFYHPGTHLLPELTPADWDGPAGDEHYERYEAFIGDRVAATGVAAEPALLEKGQALLWNGNLLHGGAPRLDPDRTRHSQVTHYFFAGCRYWTPLRSTVDEIEWRSPCFIPELTSRRARRLIGR
jgi:hypothetical protein